MSEESQDAAKLHGMAKSRISPVKRSMKDWDDEKAYILGFMDGSNHARLQRQKLLDENTELRKQLFDITKSLNGG